MIFPILKGLVSWRKAPITWAVIFLNFLVLLYTSSVGVHAQRELEEIMRNPFFVRMQGRIYATYLDEHRAEGYPEFLLELADQVNAGQSERFAVLGQLGFRDLLFTKAAAQMEFPADVVGLKMWQKRTAQVRTLQELHPSFTFGLNGEDTGVKRWLSYIFVHSGAMHFVGNMLFLVIFGSMLEIQIGGLGFLVVFLLSGAMGAGVFALLTGMTSSPLVGASGAVSGIMMLYCVLNWNRPARYFYWLFLPFRGFMGFIYLPTWLAMGFWGVNDVAGYIGTVPELGGVAHAAHLGGEGAGLLIAIILYVIRQYFPVQQIQPDPLPRNVVMGRLLPFLPARILKVKSPA